MGRRTLLLLLLVQGCAQPTPPDATHRAEFRRDYVPAISIRYVLSFCVDEAWEETHAEASNDLRALATAVERLRRDAVTLGFAADIEIEEKKAANRPPGIPACFTPPPRDQLADYAGKVKKLDDFLGAYRKLRGL